MANANITDFQAFINNQIQLQEHIEIYLSQIKSYIEIAKLSDDFYEFKEHILRDYFCGVTQIIDNTIEANQNSLHELLNHRG